MDKIDSYFYDERLQLLKQATLINYFDDFSFQEDESKNLELLDVLLEHLYKGDLDFCFQAKSLLGVDLEEREEIFKLVRKYMPLCFYAGNPEFWLDSIEGITLGGDNADFVCMKILENYDFLLGIARDGGEDGLRQIEAFQKFDNFKDCSVIDTLRNNFGDDDILSEIVIEMSKKEEGGYKNYNDIQKAIMCSYPNGILYTVDNDGKKERIQAEELDKMIHDYLSLSLVDYNLNSFLEIISERDFQDLIFDIHYDKASKKMM